MRDRPANRAGPHSGVLPCAALVLLAACEITSVIPADTPDVAPVDVVGLGHLAFDCSSQASIPPSECEALIAFYSATNGDNWTNNTGWLASPDPCSWFGVACSGGSVAFLVPSDNQLSGSLPPELGNLPNLELLNLDRNQLSGPIPPELGNLAKLQGIHLYQNQLSGSIPTELGNLGDLMHLWLQENQLTGSIPSELGGLTSAQWLQLQDNELSGSVPPELGNLADLIILDLSRNQLSGATPPELGGLANLESLTLDSNHLEGPLPPEFGSLVSLRSLRLVDNRLTGSIPAELGNLPKLQDLTLTRNQLSGSIPPELGHLTTLGTLLLDRNQLSGAIPPQLGNLTNLAWLLLLENNLSGSIPPELGNLSNLTILFLGNNALSGLVPESVARVGGSANACDFAQNTGLYMPDTPAYREADLDGDSAICSILLGGDSDGDGIPDSSDPDLLANLIGTLPGEAFKSGGGGHRTAMQSILAGTGDAIAAGRVPQALRRLTNLRRRVDGCGAVADRDDWVVDCTVQAEIRSWIDTLLLNLTE